MMTSFWASAQDFKKPTRDLGDFKKSINLGSRYSSQKHDFQKVNNGCVCALWGGRGGGQGIAGGRGRGARTLFLSPNYFIFMGNLRNFG